MSLVAYPYIHQSTHPPTYSCTSTNHNPPTHPNPKPIQAYVVFETVAEAQHALKLDKEKIGERWIDLFLSSTHELYQAIPTLRHPGFAGAAPAGGGGGGGGGGGSGAGIVAGGRAGGGPGMTGIQHVIKVDGWVGGWVGFASEWAGFGETNPLVLISFLLPPLTQSPTHPPTHPGPWVAFRCYAHGFD